MRRSYERQRAGIEARHAAYPQVAVTQLNYPAWSPAATFDGHATTATPETRVRLTTQSALVCRRRDPDLISPQIGLFRGTAEMAGLAPMERVWVFDTLAIAVARVDFIDPAVAHLPDARERGVRVEIRPAGSDADGSVYVSTTIALRPALCRIDLLESRPHAADRTHWHPGMRDGEPHERVFDPALSGDPLGWVAAQLADVGSLVDDPAPADAAAIAAAADEILAAIRAGLAWAREPWPAVDHDDRGMARV